MTSPLQGIVTTGMGQTNTAGCHHWPRLMKADTFKLPVHQKVKGEERQMKEHIRKQDLEIENLLEEQEQLKQSLHTACPLPQPHPTLLKKCENLDEELEKEKQIHQELEKEIAEMELIVEELKNQKRMDSDTLRAKNNLQVVKVKLDNMTQDFNMQEVDCQLHRDEVEQAYNEYRSNRALMIEREKELGEIRRQLEETIKQSTNAENEILKFESSLETMTLKHEHEIAKYTNAMSDLEVEVAHQKKLKEFIAIKNKKRNILQNVHERKSMVLQAVLESYTEHLNTLKELHQEIVTVSEDNIDAAINIFNNVERRYFVLFSDVINQDKEILCLKKEIAEIQSKLASCKPKHQPDLDHCSVMSDLNKELEEVESHNESQKRHKDAILKFLDDIRPGLDHACSVLEFEPTEKGIMLDPQGKILFSLDVVEEKTTELLTIQYYLNNKDLDEGCKPSDSTKYLLGQDPEQLQQSSRTIQNIETEDSDYSENEWPLSREQLIKQVKEKMEKGRTADEKEEAKTPTTALQEQMQMIKEQGTTAIKTKKSKCPKTVAEWNKQVKKEEARAQNKKEG